MNKNINPTAKLLVNLVILLCSVCISDPFTIILLFMTCVIYGICSRTFTVNSLKTMMPMGVFALAMLWMNAACARTDHARIIGTFVLFHFTDQGLAIGISIFFRILTISFSSILFISTTDADDLLLSLIQQCHLNPAIAYGVLTAFRFYPLMKSDLAQIDAAHQIRAAVHDKKGSGKISWYRKAIPLLASNIRRAEQVSVAMEARGFETGMHRTYHRSIRWKVSDTAFVTAACLLIAVILFVSWQMGWLLIFYRWKGF